MTHEPRRLLDDPQTPSELRHALDQASRHAPPIDALAGLERLERAMQGAGGGAGGSGKLGGSGGVGLAGVVGAGIAVLAVVGGVMLWNGERDETEAPRRADVPEARDPGDVPSEAPLAAVGDESAPDGVITETSAPSVATEPVEARRAARPPRDEDDALAREMAELAAARAALVDDPRRALSMLERGRRRSGSRSLFAEEREALTVLALSGLDRDEDARRRGASFLEAHPTSAFAERVRRAIREP